MKINNHKHKQVYQYSISLKIYIIVDIRGICRRTYLSIQNGIIFYAKRNSARKVAFDMLTNAGPTYGMFVGPTSDQSYMSNVLAQQWPNEQTYVGPT